VPALLHICRRNNPVRPGRRKELQRHRDTHTKRTRSRTLAHRRGGARQRARCEEDRRAPPPQGSLSYPVNAKEMGAQTRCLCGSPLSPPFPAGARGSLYFVGTVPLGPNALAPAPLPPSQKNRSCGVPQHRAERRPRRNCGPAPG
jgi:hypothetical protein